MASCMLLALMGAWAFFGNAAPSEHPLVYDNLVIKDRQGNVVSRIFSDSPTTQSMDMHTERFVGLAEGELLVDARTFSDGRKLRVVATPNCMRTEMSFRHGLETKSIIELGDAFWYGGGEEIPQKWPLNKYVGLEHSMVTQNAGGRGVQDPLWFSSEGRLIFVERGAPLFLKWNSNDTADQECKGKLCLRFKDEAPYRPRPGGVRVKIWQCELGDAKKAFHHAVDNWLGKPTGHPDERMIKYPVWSTWARYKSAINDVIVREFAKEIKEHGFQNSQVEIDDAWESCYGSKIVDTKRFPNLKQLTDDLKKDGFRVTIWTHPFINSDCTETLEEAKSKGFLVKNTDGDITTHWWNGVASIVDFTNPDAANWFAERHHTMMRQNGIDGFKFDAGETSWFPQLPDLPFVKAGPEEDYPSAVVNSYTRTCAAFNNLTEVRSAYRTQDLPIFLRMLDKDSRWGDDNGLKSLITTLLQMNMVGYSMVLPDMIGGNQYNLEVADQELFLRWLQANVFMPALQYSLVPWDYGDKTDETVKISKKFNDLHAKYTDTIVKAMKKNIDDGSPVNPPIWWIDPSDARAQAEDTEYLLGDSILVAPVLEKGARSRKVYLPKGQWRDGNDAGKTYIGPAEMDYPAPLDTLPWFILEGSDADKIGSAATTASSVISALGPEVIQIV